MSCGSRAVFRPYFISQISDRNKITVARQQDHTVWLTFFNRPRTLHAKNHIHAFFFCVSITGRHPLVCMDFISLEAALKEKLKERLKERAARKAALDEHDGRIEEEKADEIEEEKADEIEEEKVTPEKQPMGFLEKVGWCLGGVAVLGLIAIGAYCTDDVDI